MNRFAVLLVAWLGAGSWAVVASAWEVRLDHLRDAAAELHGQLVEVHGRLSGRVVAEQPALGERLTHIRLHPRERGYGLLPEILPSPGPAPVLPVRTLYTLDWVEEHLATETVALERLLETVEAGGTLETLIDDYEERLSAYRDLEDHLDYHAFWQREAERNPLAFRERNRLLPVAEELAELLRSGSAPERAQALREDILDAIRHFRPTTGLRLEEAGEDRWVMKVGVCTDIGDAPFLHTFAAAVNDAFDVPVAGTGRRLDLDIHWRPRTASSLYDGAPPARGTPLDVQDHLSRFTNCGLVLTTGAASTHAYIGTSIVLGTEPLAGRVLAHEFGHMLGFSDSYFRGFRGAPGSPEGVTFIEWHRLSADLMGDPQSGRVTPGMVKTLVEGYGQPGVTVRTRSVSAVAGALP